jgi:hypothetical protein
MLLYARENRTVQGFSEGKITRWGKKQEDLQMNILNYIFFE